MEESKHVEIAIDVRLFNLSQTAVAAGELEYEIKHVVCNAFVPLFARFGNEQQPPSMFKTCYCDRFMEV